MAQTQELSEHLGKNELLMLISLEKITEALLKSIDSIGSQSG